MGFKNGRIPAVSKAHLLEFYANNPKLKTGETVSRFELNSSVKQPFRSESLLGNQKINQAGLILDQKIEISELQPQINLLVNWLSKVKCRWTRKPEMLKPGNTENRKWGNPDHPEIRSRRQFQQLETAAFVQGFFSTLRHVKDNLNIGRNSLRYRGPRVWELTPTSLKQSPSLKNLKNLLKQRHHKNFINNCSFLKEACMVSHKNQDFEYFQQSNFYPI